MPTGVTVALDRWLDDEVEKMTRRENAYVTSGTEQIEIGSPFTIIIARTPESLRALAAICEEAAAHMENTDLVLDEGVLVPNRPDDVDTQAVIPSAFHEG